MTVIMIACAGIAMSAYTIASWAAADGLPLIRDWHYWVGAPFVAALGCAAGWLLSLAL